MDQQVLASVTSQEEPQFRLCYISVDFLFRPSDRSSSVFSLSVSSVDSRSDTSEGNTTNTVDRGQAFYYAYVSAWCGWCVNEGYLDAHYA